MDYGHANLSFAASLLDGAADAGLGHVVICPGSRSTPLALAAALHPALRTWVLIDERSAAFFALGVARHLGKAVGLICTSGTAAANFAPAVIEAYLSRIPLLVLTADRPAELRDWGAAQTIDQVGLYGSHVRWFADLPAPVGDASEERFARAASVRALQTADSLRAGPVHLNVQFREPLIPADADPTALLRDRFARPSSADAPPRSSRSPSDAEAARLADLVSRHPRGVIVGGPHAGGDLGNAVAALSAASGYPVLADPLSTVRFSWPGGAGLVDAYDLFLRDAHVAAPLEPDLVIRVGGMPTSKPLAQWLAHQDATVVAIDPGELRDAGHAVAWHVQADDAAALLAVTTALAGRRHVSTEWLRLWERVNAQTRAAVTRQL
ncbi:MAG: 2-succinyl-5-enolpyruvyl-6-hydroxy-3-cyclohexene-1-carboxylic-acid synthase, partial [Thermomicrobiales bacterium]|nr:2-succinyl-5-enolpyruvyl-6-hydroxy-3-cyclohexene-1-carboxylic-acid synthase [Thermomicrobiales bacterium]